MADIRQSPIVKDYFTYPDGTLLDGSSPATSWVSSDTGVWTPCEINEPDYATHKAGSGSSMSSWIADDPMDGDDAEVWARAVGGGALSGIAWGIALFTDVGGSGAVDGYRARWEAPGPPYVLYKWTNAGVSTLATSAGTNAMAEHYVMLRRNGAAVELWVSDNPSDASAWSLQVSANDNAYTTGLRASIGCTDNGAGQILGWQEFGFGPRPEGRTQIYRVLEGTSPFVPA